MYANKNAKFFTIKNGGRKRDEIFGEVPSRTTKKRSFPAKKKENKKNCKVIK